MIPTTIDWAMLAAYIDGEGCITVATSYCSKLVLNISNTDPRLTTWCKDKFGGSICRHSRTNNGNRRPLFVWQVSQVKAQVILENCLPYFKIKREQAEVALAIRAATRKPGSVGQTKALSQEEKEVRFGLRNELARLKKELPC